MSKKRGLQIPIFLGIASVWFATHAGPGAAAGKLSAVYFSEFGRWGLITPAIAMLIMGICIYVGVEYSRIRGITNFNEFTNSFFDPYGKIFSLFFDITYLLGVLVALAAGIATAAGVISQYTGIPFALASFAIVAVSILLSIFGEEVVRSASTVMTIIIVVSLATIVFTGLSSPLADFAGNWEATSWSDHSFFKAALQAFIYAGVLTSGCVANSISVSEGLESTKEAKKAAVTGFIMNLFLSGSVAYLLFAYPQFIETSIPNYHVVELLDMPILLLAYVVMVVLAVLSTAVSYAYSTAARYTEYIPMEAGPKRDLVVVLLLFGVSFAISLLGLDTIINKGYTILGYVAIPTVIVPLLILGNSKIKKARREEGLEA